MGKGNFLKDVQERWNRTVVEYSCTSTWSSASTISSFSVYKFPQVCINDVIFQGCNPNLPFGGVGGSGIGKYRGKHGFDEFSHHRAVMVRGTMMDKALGEGNPSLLFCFARTQNYSGKQVNRISKKTKQPFRRLINDITWFLNSHL